MIHHSEGWTCLHAQVTCTNKLSLDNRGLAYGDGFFTTMGVVGGAILWSEYHYQRLVSHALALQLNLDSRALLLTLQAHAQQLEQGMLKLIVTRAVQSVRGYGYMPSESGSACEIWLKSVPMTITSIEHWRLPDDRMVPMQPIMSAVCLDAQLACLPTPLAGLKSLNRLDNVLASGELQHFKQKEGQLSNSVGEGLVRDLTGCWIEGTMSNVFYQLNTHTQTFDTSNQAVNNQWFTPPLDISGVHGVMRAVIIDAFVTSATPIIERPLTDEDLPYLSQLFFCNALRGIMPVDSLTLLSGEVINFI